MTARGMMMKVAVLLAVAPLALAGQAQAQVPASLLDSKGYLIPDYVGIANWAFSPMPTTVEVGNPRIERTGSPGDSATNVLVVSPAVLPAGTLTAFQTWSQAGTAGSFNAYVLRRVAGSPTAYTVVFDSGPLSAPAAGLATFAISPLRVQAGDRIAHLGQGVPFDMSAAGMDAVHYPTTAVPAAGATITLGDATYPVFDPAVYGQQPRTYSFGAVVDAGGLRKFVDSLPGLTAAGVNNLGQYLPVGVPDTASYPGSDYYEIELGEYSEKMHSDLPPTRLRGYRQTNVADASVSAFHFLGPILVAQKDRPIRVKFTNKLPTGAAGKLFIPMDETSMGAGLGPLTAAGAPCDNTLPAAPCASYPENRATIHLHGGRTPWISDGTPHQWITPAGEVTPFKKGASLFDVPDMPAPGAGSQTFYFTNQQSARLMFYHDHAYGITRLNVYVGEAAGLVLRDPVEQQLVADGVIPADEIPLVIQDRTWVDANAILATDPTWRWGTGTPVDPDGAGPMAAVPPPVSGDLWYPHVYVPAQNPYDFSGANPFGRWHYGPWFWPPTTNITYGPVPNPYAALPGAPAFQPPEMPGVPHPSAPGESFLDTPIVNGTAYPTLTVQPKSYRFRILNAANDRFWNLQFYVAADKNSPTTQGTTGAVLCDNPGIPASRCTEVKMVPAAPNAAFPANWPKDGRAGGAPDPATRGPSFIQFGSEGGFLPAPTVVENQPIVWNANPTTFNFGNVDFHGLLVAPAERADVVVDFSAYAGKTLIVYNDAPAAYPALDPRYDYYTGAPDQRDTGGTAGTAPGYGPNTRTIMQIVVAPATPAPAFDLAALQAAFACPTGTPAPGAANCAFRRAQHDIVAGQGDIDRDGVSAYDTAYGTTFPAFFPNWGISRIQDNALSFMNTGGVTQTINMEPKALHDEMGAAYDLDYGRMSGKLGLEIKLTNALNQTFILQNFTDAPTEIVSAVQLPGPATSADGTQVWKITHNGVDTHPIHFHIFDVQVINRVGWDGAIRLPDQNELGWKDTVRLSPLEDTIVAIRAIPPKMPFGIPDSYRPMSPATPIGSPMGLSTIDPFTGQPLVPAPTNQLVNFGWEYVWHCHILSHEEMDMMRPVALLTPRNLAAAPVLTVSPAFVLDWTDGTPAADPATLGNPANEIGFRIERAPGGTSTFAVVGTALANATTFTDGTATAGGYYAYRVVAFNAAGDTTSNVVTLNTPPPPSINAPTNLVAAIASNTRITLSWIDASINETSFEVFRSTNGGAFASMGTVTRSGGQIASTGTTVNVNQGAGPGAEIGVNPQPGNTYTYYVVARMNGGATASLPSNNVTVEFRAPVAPTGLAGAAVRIAGSNTNDRVTLTWTDASSNETTFEIQRDTQGGGFNWATTGTVAANVVTFSQNVSRQSDFNYRVRAVNAVGTSAWSNVVLVTTP